MNKPDQAQSAQLPLNESEEPGVDPVAEFSFITSSGPLVAEVVDARHPTLCGRVLIRLHNDRGEPLERWVPTLHRLPVRKADRVLVIKPGNWSESLVVGVIDGFARRPELSQTNAATVELDADQVVRVVGSHGAPLVEVYESDEGAVVRLVDDDVNLEIPGKLRVAAKSLSLTARQGEVRVEATADVVISGEQIQLN